MHTTMQLTTQLQSPADRPIYLRTCQNTNSQKVLTEDPQDQAKHDTLSTTGKFILPATRPPTRVGPAVRRPMIDEQRQDLPARPGCLTGATRTPDDTPKVPTGGCQ